jgi:hypothetical protein
MGEERRVGPPTLRVLKGEGRGEQRALRRLTGPRHRWLLLVGLGCAVLAAGAFLLAPAFSLRVPRLTPEEVAAGRAGAQGNDPLVTGLAEVLDLDAAGTLALRHGLERFDVDERDAALDVLRGAAAGAAAEAAGVDAALVRLRAALRRLAELDGELVEAVSAGRTPAQKARAALLLGRHHERVAPEGKANAPHRGAAAPTAPASGAPDARLAPARTAPAARP